MYVSGVISLIYFYEFNGASLFELLNVKPNLKLRCMMFIKSYFACKFHILLVIPLSIIFRISANHTWAYGPAHAQPPLAWMPNRSLRRVEMKLWWTSLPVSWCTVRKEKMLTLSAE